MFPQVTNRAAAQVEGTVPQTLTGQTPGIINVDGDFSMSENQNRMFWNPHATGTLDSSNWAVTFDGEACVFLQTKTNEHGHVATGAWWNTGFVGKEKIAMYDSKPTQILASFRANVSTVKLDSGTEWLRIALACAIQRATGEVVYTEMDFWDSPTVLSCPSGNVGLGGDVVYRGGDVVEYKLGQVALGELNGFSLNLTKYVDSAWSLRPGDVLESAYFVVEVVGGVTVGLRACDLWIAKFE